MAYYQIIIELSNGKVIEGVRELPEQSIDQYWTTYEMKSAGVYRHSMVYFNIVQLSKFSTEVKQYLAKLNSPPPAPSFRAIMKRSKNEDRKNSSPGSTLGDRVNKE